MCPSYTTEKMIAPAAVAPSIQDGSEAPSGCHSSQPTPEAGAWVPPCKRTFRKIQKMLNKHFKPNGKPFLSVSESFLARSKSNTTGFGLDEWTSDVHEALLNIATRQEFSASPPRAREPIYELDANPEPGLIFELDSASRVDFAFEIDSPPGPVTIFELDSNSISELESTARRPSCDARPPPIVRKPFVHQPRGVPNLMVPPILYKSRTLRAPLHNLRSYESTCYIPAKISALASLAKLSPIPEIIVSFEDSTSGFWTVPPHVGGTALPSSNGYYNGTKSSLGSACYSSSIVQGNEVIFDAPMHSEIMPILPKRWTKKHKVWVK